MPAHTRQGSHRHRALTLGGGTWLLGPTRRLPSSLPLPLGTLQLHVCVWGGLAPHPAGLPCDNGRKSLHLPGNPLSLLSTGQKPHSPPSRSEHPNLPAQAPRPWKLRLSQISGEVQTHWSATAPEKHLGWWTHGQCLLLRGHRGAPWGPPSRKNLGLRGKEHQLTASSSIFRDSNPLLLMF